MRSCLGCQRTRLISRALMEAFPPGVQITHLAVGDGIFSGRATSLCVNGPPVPGSLRPVRRVGFAAVRPAAAGSIRASAYGNSVHLDDGSSQTLDDNDFDLLPGISRQSRRQARTLPPSCAFITES